MKPQIVIANERMRSLAARARLVKAGVFAAIIAAMLLMTGSISFRGSVFVTDEGVTKEIKTNYSDVYAILKAEKYDLGPDDKVTVTTDKNKEMHITILRAFNVSVTADGKTALVQFTEGKASDAIKAAGVEIGKDDVLSCSLTDDLYAGMDIKVTRVKYVDRQLESDKPFDVVYKDNSNLVMGKNTVITEGKKGTHTVYFRDTYVDGKLLYTEQTGEKVTKQPVTQVVERGTALAEPWSKMENPEELKLVNGLPENYTRKISGKATAYSARPGSLTASGRYAVVGTVAVNPNVIPYGSELYIVSQDGTRVYGYAIAADTGTGLMDGTVAIDVFTANYDDSCRWGAVYCDIYVLSEGDNSYISRW